MSLGNVTYRAILLFKNLALSVFRYCKKKQNKKKKKLKQTALYLKLCLYLGYFLGTDDQEWDH